MKKIFLFLLLIGAFVQFACKKNSNSGPPVVTDVRTPAPATKDSTFNQALPGTLIVIQGHGFSGLEAVYFNDTSAYFNPVYVTDNNIIISIPSTAQTAATNPSVPNTIRIVTSHGTTTYTFTLFLHAPTITSISLDSTGTIATISGTNFIGVQKITFPVSGPDTPKSYKVDTGHQFITTVIPTGTPFTDSVRVYCTYGVASFPYPPPMLIKSVSNENAIAGDTITLTGTNFIGIKDVTFPGNTPASSFTVNSVTQLTAIVPAGITTPDSIRISGVLGTSASPQLFDSYITHPSPGYLSTFDNSTYGVLDNTSWVNWTGAFATSPSTTYPNGTGGFTYLVNAGSMTGNSAPISQGNSSAIQLNDVPWVANTSTSVAGYSLKFEVYVAAPWKAGELWVMVGDWYGWTHYLARFAPWSTAPGGIYQPSGWTTVTIPLTQFINPTNGGTSVIGYGGKVNSPITDASQWDYESWPVGGTPPSKFSDFGPTSLCFAIVNDQASPSIPANGLNIGIDNVRIVQGQ